MKAKKRRSFFYSLAVILFFVCTVFILGPFELFYENAEEFWFSSRDVGRSVFVVAGTVFVFLSTFFIIAPKKIRFFCEKLLFGISLGLFIQARINISYGNGVLDGQEIPWEQYNRYGLMSSAVWLGCMAVPFIITSVRKKNKKSSRKVIAVIAVFLTVIQIPDFIVQTVNYHNKQTASSDFIITADGMFDLSAKSNVLVFILDTMDEAYYRTFVSENPDFTKDLTGFVHYENALASGARTPVAVPSMLTGIPYRREDSYTVYKDEVWAGENPLRILHDKGYDVSVYSESVLFSKNAVNYISNFKNGKPVVRSIFSFSKKLYKLDFLKFAPHYIKRFFWMNTAEFSEYLALEENNTYLLDDAKFFADYISRGFSFNNNNKSVRIYHLDGAHVPFTLSKDGKRIDKSTREDQVFGCLMQIKSMLEDLKNNGIYDEAVIIITADHGDNNKGEHPVFLVKESGADVLYSTSSSPVSLFDLPILLAGITEETLDNQQYGLDLHKLAEDQVRERHFFYNTTNNNNKVLIKEYVTTALAEEYDKLKLYKSYGDSLGKETLYKLGTKLSFAMDATGNRYITDGFGKNSGERTRVRAKYNRLEIPIADLPEKGMIKGVASTNTYIRTTPYIMKVNGITVMEAKTSKSLKDFTFEVPVSSFKDSNVLVFELEFPEYESIKNEITYNGIIAFKALTITAKK